MNCGETNPGDLTEAEFVTTRSTPPRQGAPTPEDKTGGVGWASSGPESLEREVESRTGWFLRVPGWGAFINVLPTKAAKMGHLCSELTKVL